jgi:flagellar biosynthesis protein FlhB
VLVAAVLAAAVLAVLDLFITRLQFTRRMRMTRNEMRDEQKSSDGDPYIKARLKALRQQRGRTRMLSQVPKAAVVVMNPTHYAVALAYQHGSSQAPVVIARGMDHLALAIRRKAEECHVPVVIDPPLARALYAQAKVDQMIPPEMFRAVAEVISFVLRTAASRR